VLQLEGVLFFGNAEDLSRQVRDLFDRVDIVVLDLRGVTDIDASGSAILGALVQTSHRRGKLLLFCNVTAEHDVHVRSLFGDAGGAEAGIKPDLETALEWVEEEMLRGGLDERSREAILPLERIDLLDDLSAAEMSELRPLLKPREFATGDAICREGDPGDRLWLLAKGSVSVRLNVDDRRGSRRIASLGRGTVVGEMALIDGNRRSASIVADEAVVCYELSTGDFDRLQRDRPGIAAKIMRNTARELARRLRRTSEDLRNATS
jgi:ABC-type transporter Mla MlaB component